MDYNYCYFRPRGRNFPDKLITEMLPSKVEKESENSMRKFEIETVGDLKKILSKVEDGTKLKACDSSYDLSSIYSIDRAIFMSEVLADDGEIGEDDKMNTLYLVIGGL